MATLLNLLDDLRDRLADPTDTKFSRTQKVRWINRGQAAMFPKVHRVIVTSNTDILIVANDYEYTLPVGFEAVKVLGVEVESAVGSQRFVRLDGRDFDVLPGGSGRPAVKFVNQIPSVVGAIVRVTAAAPLTTLSLDGDTYTGILVSEELPVIYAMSVCMARDIEARLQYYRFSTTQGFNGTALEDFLTSSQFWMAHFMALLDQVQMPLSLP